MSRPTEAALNLAHLIVVHASTMAGTIDETAEQPARWIDQHTAKLDADNRRLADDLTKARTAYRHEVALHGAYRVAVREELKRLREHTANLEQMLEDARRCIEDVATGGVCDPVAEQTVQLKEAA